MTISTQRLFPHAASHALIFFASFFLFGAAVGGEQLPTESNVSTQAKTHNLTDRASELAMQSMGMLGIKYKRGGDTPESGLDCSGLVRHIYKEAWGANLPRTSVELSHVGEVVKTQDLLPGDLVFFNTLKRKFSHVGIYLGEHKFIHSPSPGGQVRIESMEVSYWKKRFNGARRISDPEQPAALPALSATTSIADPSKPFPF